MIIQNSKCIILGAGGFIGNHLVDKLKKEGSWVRGVDLKYPEFSETKADEFIIGDLTDPKVMESVIENGANEVYVLAAKMGGANYIFSKNFDADIISESALININAAKECTKKKVKKVFFSSSACVYAEHNQLDPNNPICSEDSCWPLSPDSIYGIEKAFAEQVYLSFQKNYGLNVRIARFHNIMGPCGNFDDLKGKAPASLCRKIAEAVLNGKSYIEVMGTGQQSRSFLDIETCLLGVEKLMNSEFTGPVNIGSTEMISINNFAKLIMDVAGVSLDIRNIPGNVGVNGRNSDNRLIKEKLGWEPTTTLRSGIEKLYPWILEQVKKQQEQT